MDQTDEFAASLLIVRQAASSARQKKPGNYFAGLFLFIGSK
jgi:hypothetical protein